MIERLRAWVRHWLGIDNLATSGLIQALEKANRTRHTEIMAALGRIEAKMTVEHINPAKQFTPPQLDWDAVQAIAAYNLEHDPNKE